MNDRTSGNKNQTQIGIASMPFNDLEIPSLAAGTLQAFLARELPDHRIDSRLPYVRYAETVGKALYTLMGVDFMLGRAAFGMQLYPQKKDQVREYFRRKLPEYVQLLEPKDQALALDVLLDLESDNLDAEKGSPETESPQTSIFFQGEPALATEQDSGADGLFAYLDRLTKRFVDEAVEMLSADTDMVIFVLGSAAARSYVESSLFPSLSVAKELKRRNPRLITIFAGFGGISYGLAQPLLDEYPFLDHVVEGEVEGQLLSLLCNLSDPKSSLANPSVPVNVEQLPTPDYSAYAEWADNSSLVMKWTIPIESARGCWWDRVDRKNDSFATCFFCNRHGLGYREKDPRRVAAEMKEQALRYGHSRFDFADSLVRMQNVEEAVNEIRAQEIPFSFLQHARAQISPYEILCLWQAGMLSAQIGVEGLSTRFLRRIGKGTTTIQNLQAMKIFYELKITNAASNLLIDFPGATEAEVFETVDNIRKYAIAYQPLQASPFWLIRTTTVERNPEHFGISNLRNRDSYKIFLPEKVWQRLPLPLMDYDLAEPAVSWEPVRQALADWEKFHQESRRTVLGANYHHTAPLYYKDHGVSLEIVDRRDGLSVYTLNKMWRDVYLFVAEIHGRSAIERYFANQYSADQISEVLEQCVAVDLMFCERDKYLSLAVALYPHWAAERIRQAHLQTGRSQSDLPQQRKEIA